MSSTKPRQQRRAKTETETVQVAAPAPVPTPVVAEPVVAEQQLDQADQVDGQSYDALCTSFMERINESYNTIRSLRADFRTLERMHRVEMKNSRRNRKTKSTRGSKKPSGFNKPCTVPEQIVRLLGLEAGVELPRTQITKLIYGYIKDNGLQDPKDKRTINPDKKLQKLFSLASEEQISFYNIQTHIKKLYPTVAEEAPATTSVAAPATTVAAPEPVAEKKTKARASKKEATAVAH
jgi:chromatin remodeling complex protein RSC6